MLLPNLSMTAEAPTLFKNGPDELPLSTSESLTALGRYSISAGNVGSLGEWHRNAVFPSAVLDASERL